MKFISGTHLDPIGVYIGEHWASNTGSKLTFPYTALGVHNGEKLLGSILFINYNGSNIEVHLYTEGAVNKSTFKFFFNYVFNQLKCNILRTMVIASNPKYVRRLERLGFEKECVLEQYFGPSDNEAAVLLKFKRQWADKWIELK